jgi:hypothetical protein
MKVQFNNGDEKTLFEFSPDENSFKESEFIITSMYVIFFGIFKLC